MDGVINVDYGYVHKKENFLFTNRIFEVLRWIKSKGYLIFIVTNQSGIGRGIFNVSDFNILNNLNLKKVNLKKFPLVKLLKILPDHPSLFETVLITVNDYLVLKFLNKQINFQKLISLIYEILNQREFLRFKKIKPKNIDDIYQLRLYVSSKMDSLGI